MVASNTTDWVAGQQCLMFQPGNYRLMQFYLPGVALDIPITRLTTEEMVLPWQKFPDGVKVAVVPGQPTDRRLPRLRLSRGAIRYIAVFEDRCVVNVQGAFADYLKNFSAKPRHNLLRSVRKFTEFSGGKIFWREFSSPEEIVGFQQIAIEISQKSHKRDLNLGFPESAEFTNELLSLAARNLARGYVLYHREQPVAYVFCRVQCENLIYSHIGYDSEFRTWSPGTILLYLLLEKLFAEQEFKYLDFAGGGYFYKSFFSTKTIRCARVLYFRWSLRNLLLVISHFALELFWEQTSKLLQRFGVKDKLRPYVHRVLHGTAIPKEPVTPNR